MTENIIDDLILMEDEPIITEENDALLSSITNIERTSEFEAMGLTEEKLDELVQCLGNQESFASELQTIAEELEKIKSIMIELNDEDEDYI